MGIDHGDIDWDIYIYNQQFDLISLRCHQTWRAAGKIIELRALGR